MKPGDETTAEPREWADPATGRKIIQLTSGPAFDYPLYFYIPTTTKDGRSLVFHRLLDGEMQYHRLDIETGRVVCLTGARTPSALWRPWWQAPAFGAREYMGALNVAHDELVYFDGNDLRAVQVFTLADRLVTRLPADRVPCGLTGVSPDGRHFVFPHADRAWWEANPQTGPEKHTARGVRVELVRLADGATRSLVAINSWITHTNFYDDERVLFAQPATEPGVLITDLAGGWYLCVRAQSPEGRQSVHYQATRRGVMYEWNTLEKTPDRRHGMLGRYNPDTRERREYRVGARITHVGLDPEGTLWFGEQLREVPNVHRVLGWFPRLGPGFEGEFVPLTGPIMAYGEDLRLQRTHTHPALMPDRRHILFTGGDDRTRTNHPFLLDVSDLANAQTELTP